MAIASHTPWLDSRSYQEIRHATCDYVVRCWDWLGWGHITNKADAKRWAAKCRIDGEWLETDFILAYCHMHRINMTITMIDWRVVESGCRELYLKQFLTGALDKPRYSHRLLAYIN